MNTGRKKSILPYIPGYDNNAVLKLTFFLAGAYIMLAMAWAIVMLVMSSDYVFNTYFSPNIALPAPAAFLHKPWTIITYGLFHFPNTFMKMVSNMLWLYCFGSVMQMLIGKKQVVPVFMYSVISGGILYLLGQLLPGGLGKAPQIYMGPIAGLMGMAAAAYTLSPKYRFYLSETFSIPMAVVAGVFTLLMLIDTGFYMPLVLMLVGGALTGYLYVKTLQAGYRPAQWIYNITGGIERFATPDESALRNRRTTRNSIYINQYRSMDGVSSSRVDEILDKINQKGYNSLSKEEKEILLRAGKE